MAEQLESRTLLSTYDAAAMFSTTANPNGVWAYGEFIPGGSGFVPYTTPSALDIGGGAVGWTAGSTSPPYVGEAPDGSSGLTVVLPPGVLDMHPGANGEYSVVQFTAPTAGPLSVTFTYTGIDNGNGTTTDVHVLHNLASIADGSINGYGDTFSNTISNVTVAAGDTIDFTVGWGANQDYTFDSTSLSAQITLGGGIAVIGQPSDTAAKDTIAPVKVAVLDANGNLDTAANTAITVAIASTSTGTGMLTGTQTVNTVDGVATFSDLSIDTPGQYSFTFIDTAGDTTASGLLEISGGKLVFTPGPVDGTAKQPLKPTVTVSLEDGTDAVITDNSKSTVTLSIYGNGSSNPISGNVEKLKDGVATFPDLTLDETGFYKLQATDDENDADSVSTKFKIAGDHIAFLKQPASSDINTPLPLKVALEDSKNKVDTDASDTLALSLVTISGGVNAVLSGTTVLNFVKGVATFSAAAAPMINAAGTYSLMATEEDESTGVLAPVNTSTPIPSKPFMLAGFKLLVKKQPPASLDVLSPIPFTVELVDKRGKVDTSENAAQVQLSLNSASGDTTAMLGGTTLVTFNAGVATFSASAAPTVNHPGTFTLTATETGVDSPAIPAITKSFKVNGYKFRSQAVKVGATGDGLALDQFNAEQFDLLSSSGTEVTSAAALPDIQPSLSSITGDGTLVGITISTPHFFSGVGIVYDVLINVTEPGTYMLTLSQTVPADGSAAPTVIEPGKFNLTVLQDNLNFSSVRPLQVQANKPTAATFSVGDPVGRNFHLELLAGVGFILSLSGDPSEAGIQTSTGTQIDNRTIAIGQTGSLTSLPYTIDTPGVYTLTLREVYSSSGVFDPASAAAVDATKVHTETLKVFPDKLVFTVLPPTPLTVGQTFELQVALEDSQGNVLTDITEGQDPGFADVAVLTGVFISRGGPNVLQNATPVDFSNGTATFDNLSFNAHGFFALTVDLESELNGDSLSKEVQLTVKSPLFKVTPN